MRTIVAHHFSHSAMCVVEPTRPNVTRSQGGLALNGPVVVGVSKPINIWCSAI